MNLWRRIKIRASLRPFKGLGFSSWDNLGMGLSGLCLIHCLTTPFMIPLLPFLSHEGHEQTFHLYLFFPLLGIASLAFWQGYRFHRQVRNLYVFFLGILLLLASLVFAPQGDHHLSLMTSIVGSLLLVVAHYWNRKACSGEACSQGRDL